MHKLIENAKRELKQIGEVGLNTSNLDNAYKLASIAKNAYKIEKCEEEKSEMRYSEYGRGGYNDGYNARNYRDGEYSMYDDYGRRGVPGSGRGGRYRGDDRLNSHLDRIMDSADMYMYGRERYRDSGESERVTEGLEKLMYAICSFVEGVMDFAETKEEKEIVHKHVQKMKSM